MKIYVVEGGMTDIHWIDGAVQVNSPKQADLIVFTGGSDVTPSFYRESKGEYTGPCDLNRDTKERELFLEYVGKTPMLGICRGSQFLCAMSGGKLVQHTNHPGYHPIYADNKTYMVNSTHHQMMYPFEVNHILLGFAQLCKYHLGGDNKEMEMPMLDGKAIEPEVVWFPDTMCFCVQSHPEYAGYPEETTEWLNKLIKKYVSKNSEDSSSRDLQLRGENVLSA